VPGGDSRDGVPQLGVDGSRAVDVTRCFAEPVEGEERPANRPRLSTQRRVKVTAIVSVWGGG
jgi:hypothetical protein